MPTDPIEVIKAAKPIETTVSLPLAGELVAEHEELERQLAEAQRGTPNSLEGNKPAREIAKRIVELEKQLAEKVVTFRVRGMGKKAWRALVTEHAPRSGNEGDARAGYNVDTFAAVALRKCVVSPVMDDETWDHLVDVVLSDGQYDQLAEAMWDVNRAKVSVPFSRAASRILGGSAPE